jgi:hypothetical protein
VNRRRIVQATGAAAALIVALALAGAGRGVFRTGRIQPRASLWTVLLSDRVTVGFIRLAIVIAALYIVTSLVALALGGRWLSALSTRGFATEDAWISQELARSRARQRALEEERDEAVRVAEEALEWLNRM